MSNIVIPDGGNIGSASDPDAISIPANGKPTFSQGIANSGTIDAGTIGSNVTITDGASPHGWEHIKTIAYSANTATGTSATASKMSNVVSSKYSVYKLIVQWGCASAGQDLYFRFLDTSDNGVTASNYHYGYQIISHTGSVGSLFSGSASGEAQIANDVDSNTIGFNSEILLYNCVNGSSNFPQIDGHQLATGAARYKPQALYRATGYDVGNYYQMGTGSINYDVDVYVSGFMLFFAGDNSITQHSFWSCYGLKLPTAD